MNSKKRLLWLFVLAMPPSTTAFVQSQPVRVKVEVVPKSSSLLLQSSLTNPTGGDNDNNQNFLAKLGNKITSLLPFQKKHQDKEEELGLTRAERKELLAQKDIADLARPFPWPLQQFADSLTRTINRELKQEERKAKPLLKQAVKLMNQDADVREMLGSPIKYGSVLSQSTERATINRKKSMRIVDSFEVVGSKKTGIATLIADKYASNHIHALRVDVNGVHYDIDV